jgi:hypothetical protein
MKTSVVPAQITTVEDRIAGNLGLSQLLLLTLPIFVGSALYILLPPFGHSASYKLVAITLLAVVSCSLAIRIKGKLVLHWISVLVSYNFRPGRYVYDKRSLANRPVFQKITNNSQEVAPNVTARRRQLLDLTTAEIAKAKAYMEQPAAHMSFTINRKGDLRVLITEVKD